MIKYHRSDWAIVVEIAEDTWELIRIAGSISEITAKQRATAALAHAGNEDGRYMIYKPSKMAITRSL